MSVSSEKATLRRLVRQRRPDILSRLSQQYKTPQKLARKLADLLFEIRQVADARSIFLYLNLPDEVPTVPLLFDLFYRPESAAESNDFVPIDSPIRQLAVPWCDGPGQMQFYYITPAQNLTRFETGTPSPDLESGSYGILEPNKACRDREGSLARPDKADVVLVPGVAFSRTGHRLGRGKGFYDRFLSQVHPTTLLIGLAFKEQVFDNIPHEPHDQAVHKLLLL